MKKALTILFIIIIFLILYFLQINFFTWFTIGGIKPNTFIMLMLCVTLFCGKKVGIPLGIISGIFLDVVNGRNIGVTSLMFVIIAIVASYLNKTFSKDSKITIMFMVIGCTFIFEIGSYIFDIINLKINVEIISFIKILIIEVLYNAILTIILYPLIKSSGQIVEEIFTKNKILTRYF